MTRWVRYRVDPPALNLAIEESILHRLQAGESPSAWRFWSLERPAVVIGTGGRADREVDLPACRRDGVPVLRRCSGGGTVLQGPGVFNYAALLRFDEHPGAQGGIHAAYQYVFSRVLGALGDLGVSASFEGTSDLAVAGNKISGNSQSRKSRACLVHGTILMHADTGAMARYLPHPPTEPGYRNGRGHADFLTTLADLGCRASADDLARAIAAHAGAEDTGAPPWTAEIAEAERLAAEKYSQDSWTYRL